jgi:hypothetical protein
MTGTPAWRQSFVILFAVGLASCDRQAASGSPASPEAAPPPTASVHEIMTARIVPATNALWEAAAGTDVTDAKWIELRGQADKVVEAANLLMLDGLNVVAPGQTLTDENSQGGLSATDMQAHLDAHHQQFAQMSGQLRDAGQQMLRAVEAKNMEALQSGGDALYTTCESCHQAFWYPNQKSAGGTQ